MIRRWEGRTPGEILADIYAAGLAEPWGNLYVIDGSALDSLGEPWAEDIP